MGNTQTVDLKNFETKEEIKTFMKKVDNDTQELNDQLKELKDNLKNKKPDQKLNNLINSYNEAECVCNAPSFVFWLSQKKRNECKEAKIKAFNDFLEVVNTTVDMHEINNNVSKLTERIEYLQTIKNTNEKYSN